MEYDFFVKDDILYRVYAYTEKGTALPGHASPVTIASEFSYIGPRLSPYKIKEYTFEYPEANKWVSFRMDDLELDMESRFFIDGSSYLDAPTSDGRRILPIGYINQDTYLTYVVECELNYDRYGAKGTFYSNKYTGTAHVFIRYK